MKKVLLTVTGFVVVAMLFTGVGYAAANWINFTGDEQIEQSQNNVDEILAILEEVSAEGKIDKEQVEVLTARVKELEDMNPSGLEKLNKELREENEQLKNNNAQLATDLNAKQKEINEKNQAYDNLQQERDAIATELDQAIADRNNLQAQYNTLNEGYAQIQTELTQANEYVEHLEAELTRANSLVEEHSKYTEQAVEKARTYK